MLKVLDACTIIRLVRIGLFDEVVRLYSQKLYVTSSVQKEVSLEPSRSLLARAISQKQIRVFSYPEKEIKNAYRQMKHLKIKIHFDDVPNLVAIRDLGAELVTDDHVLFEAAHYWRDLKKNRPDGIRQVYWFVMNTRGLLFELLLSGKMDLITFIKGILDLFRISELPNVSYQIKKHIIKIEDAQQLFGEYEAYLLKAIRLNQLGQR